MAFDYGPYIRKNTPLPSAVTKSSPLVGGGLKAILGGISGLLNPISGAIGVGGAIGSLFKKSPEGLKKIKDTKDQQAVEQAARFIQQKFQEGSLDYDSALEQLNSLRGRDARSDLALSNIIGEVQSKRNLMTSEPLETSPDIRGSQQFQADRLKTLLRNKAVGSGIGEGLTGTPLGKLFEDRPDPLSRFGEVRGKVGEMFPSRVTPSDGGANLDRLRKVLAGYGKLP